ncbi:MAG: hypothetical protein M3O32_00230 [Actinomycetota bacterium]|nr:hypothetical protein [Actinomycetota bacterium]
MSSGEHDESPRPAASTDAEWADLLARYGTKGASLIAHEQRHQIRSQHFRERFENGRPAPIVWESATAQTAGLRAILIDESTLRQAFIFCSVRDSAFGRWGLSDNQGTVARALASVVEALVLHDAAFASPSSSIVSRALGQGPTRKTAELLGVSLPVEVEFWLSSMARTWALEALRDKALTEVMRSLSGGDYTEDALRREVECITVAGSTRSIHKILSSLEDDGFYYDTMAASLQQRLDYATYGSTAAEVRDEADNAINIAEESWRGAIGPDSFFAAHILVRTAFYLLAADHMGVTYRGDALRRPLVAHLLGARDDRPSFAEMLVRAVEDQELAQDVKINRALKTETFGVSFPLVANAVVQRASNRGECLDIALEMRDGRHARRFRNFTRTVDQAMAEGNRHEVEQALKDLARYGVRLSEEIMPSRSIDVIGARDLIAYASPLAGLLMPLLKAPADWALRRMQRPRFALLDDIRKSPRNDAVLARIQDWWPSLPPPGDELRARDFFRMVEEAPKTAD